MLTQATWHRILSQEMRGHVMMSTSESRTLRVAPPKYNFTVVRVKDYPTDGSTTDVNWDRSRGA